MTPGCPCSSPDSAYACAHAGSTGNEVLAARGIKARQIAAAIGVSETHLSLSRTGKVRGVRFATLAKLCAALDFRPGDLLVYDASEPEPAEDADSRWPRGAGTYRSTRSTTSRSSLRAMASYARIASA